MKNIFGKNIIYYLIIFGLGIYTGISVTRFKPELFNLNQIPNNQIEATILSDKVGKLMSLPTDELPAIETVTDLTILKDKPFFAKAEINDKVLIYEKAATAVLYRPSKNIIIKTLSPNYGDAIFGTMTPTPTIVPTPVPVVTPVPTSIPTPVPSVSPTPTATPVVIPTPTPIMR